MRLPIRILLITILFIPALLIAQESNPEKPLANDEPLASSNKEPLANKEPSASSDKEPSAATDEEAQNDRDFKPSEEISEDFPVPLPSDI
ncbi:hypothetical protein OAE19_06810 [Porticoccaceae bacterium]|nr:hypothetical protein [Porticoccaceae bacterium]MDC0004094.1 hypothetical protein [Porticoccaceae bacterium]